MPTYPKSFIRDAGMRRLQQVNDDLTRQLDQTISQVAAPVAPAPLPEPPMPDPGPLGIPEEPLPAAPGFNAAPAMTEPAPELMDMPAIGTEGPGMGPLTSGLPFSADYEQGMAGIQETGTEEDSLLSEFEDTVMDQEPIVPDEMLEQEAFGSSAGSQFMDEDPSFVSSAGGGGKTGVRQWGNLIAQAAAKYGVPQSVIAGTMDIESGGNPQAVSGAGAMSLMQVMPFHFKDGENGMDPTTNVMKGAQILADNYRRWGSWDKATAAYFGAIDGQGNITGASDVGGQTGHGYVQAFTNSRANYADLDGKDGNPIGNVFDEAGNFIKSKASDLRQVFEGSLTPDQMGLSNYAAAVAACGPAAVGAWLARTGVMPNLEQITALAEAKNLWSSATGMFGTQAQVALLAANGIKATAESGLANANRVLQDLAAGNPVTFSGQKHYWTIEGFNPTNGKFDFGRSATVMGAPEFMSLQELASRDNIQDTIFADNPISKGISWANDFLSQDLNPTEGITQFKDRLEKQLFGDKGLDISLDPMEFGSDAAQTGLNFGQDQISQMQQQLDSVIDSILETGAAKVVGTAAMESTENLRGQVSGALGEPFTEEARKTRQDLIQQGDWAELTKNILGSGVKSGLDLATGVPLGVMQDAFPQLAEFRPFPSPTESSDSRKNWGVLELAANMWAAPIAGERFAGKAIGGALQGLAGRIPVQAAIVQPIVKTLDAAGKFVQGMADVGPSGLWSPAAALPGGGTLPFRAGPIQDAMSGGGGRAQLPEPPRDSWEQLELKTINEGGATFDPTQERFWTGDGYAVGGVKDPGSDMPSPTLRRVFTLGEDGRWTDENGLQPRQIAQEFYGNFRQTLDQEKAHIGTWAQPVDGEDFKRVKEIFFDASEVFDNLPEARRQSLVRGQQAAFRFGDQEKGVPSGDVPIMSEARSEGIQRALTAGRSVEDDPLLEIAQREAANIRDLDPESHFGVGTLEDEAYKSLKKELQVNPAVREDPVELKRALGIGQRVKDFLPNMPSYQDFVDAARAGARFTPWYRDIGQYHHEQFPKVAEEAGRFHFGPSSQLAPPEDNEIRTHLMLIASREAKPEIDAVLASNKSNWDKVTELTTLLRNRMEGEFRGADVTKTNRAGEETTKFNRKAVQTKPGLVQELGLSHDPGFLGNQAKVVARGIVFGDISNPGVKAPVYGPSVVTSRSDAVAPMYAVLDTHHWRGSGAWDPKIIKDLISAGKTAQSEELANWRVNQALQRAVGEELGMNIAETQAAEWVVFRTVAANVRDWQQRISNGEKWHDIFNKLVEDNPGIVEKGGGTAADFRTNPDIQAGAARVKQIEDMPAPGYLGAAVNTNNRGIDVSGVVPRGVGPTPALPFDAQLLANARAHRETHGVAAVYENAREYMQRFFEKDLPETPRLRANEGGVQQKIADEYDKLPNNPEDPRVQRAYSALADEVDDQYNFLIEKGVKFEPFDGPDPYEAGGALNPDGIKKSDAMRRDLRENGHLAVYAGDDVHPLLNPNNGFGPESANWKFRAVHDYFGHAAEGNNFAAVGEENAWAAHSKMFSDEARPAMTTETRGQNSWVNYGAHLRDESGNIPRKGQPGFIAPPDRPFAEQKAGILPQYIGGQRMYGMVGGVGGAGGLEATEGDEERELSPLQTGALAVGAAVTMNPRAAAKVAEAWSRRPKALPEGKAEEAGSLVNRLMYNGMLSQTSTALANVFSGTGEVGWKIVRDAIKNRDFQQLSAESKGAVAGFWSGLESAVQVARYGYSDIQVERAGGVSKLAPGATAGGDIMKGEKLGTTLLSTPARALSAGDEVIYNVVYSMEAHRVAAKMSKEAGFTGDEFDESVRMLISGNDKEVVEAAKKAADQATFRNELGKAGKGFEAIANNLPGGKIMFPFVHAVANITARTAERLPGVGLIPGIRAGRETADVVADQAMGTAVALGAFGMYAAGNLSGNGPTDPQERKRLQREGWQPNSIKLNGQWRSLSNLGPASGPITLIAQAGDAIKYSKDQDPKEQTLAFARNFVAQIGDQTVLGGVVDLLDLAKDRTGEGVERYAAGVAGRYIPFGGLINQASRGADPINRDPEGIPERIAARTPARFALPPALGPMGEEIPNPQYGQFESAMPFRAGPVNRVTAAERTLNEYGIEVSDMEKKKIGDVELNRDQRMMYRGLSGNLQQALVAKVQETPAWQKANESQRAAMLERVVSGAKDAAEEAVVPYADQKKARDPGVPSKYRGVADYRTEREIDQSIAKVSAYWNALEQGVKMDKPSEEDFKRYNRYDGDLSLQYTNYIAGQRSAGTAARAVR